MLEAVRAVAETLAQLAVQQAGAEDPIYTVVPVANRLRPGIEARQSPLAENGRLLRSAPAVKGDYFKVATILE